jgi:ribosomal protein S18 acetylase RimI-like enzyme
MQTASDIAATEFLGIGTNLMFDRVHGKLTREDGHLVLRTPGSPDYYYGNMLLLDAAPVDADRARLERDFARLVGSTAGIQHRCFVWPVRDDGAPSYASFTAAGYAFDEQCVLVAGAAQLVMPASADRALTLRTLHGDTDWDDWLDLVLSEMPDCYPLASYRSFSLAKRALYRQLVDQGRGDWWGAFVDGRQVAHLGLFFDERRQLGRFQSVLTASSHRGHGICRQLVHHAAQRGFARADQLVMVADEHYHAVRIYESLGFTRCERIASLCWWPRE